MADSLYNLGQESYIGPDSASSRLWERQVLSRPPGPYLSISLNIIIESVRLTVCRRRTLSRNEMAGDPDETPALQPPNGIIPNFDTPSAARLDHDIIAVVCLVLCIFAVASRTFARARIIKRFDTTDCE